MGQYWDVVKKGFLNVYNAKVFQSFFVDSNITNAGWAYVTPTQRDMIRLETLVIGVMLLLRPKIFEYYIR